MTTIPPPTNPTLPQVLATASGANAGPTATISNPPPLIAALPPGATLTGTVTPGPNPQTLVLATANGDVPLRTPVPVPAGAELTVEVVRSSQAQITVRLVSVDGQALQQALAQATKQALPETATPAPPQTQVALPTAPGTPAPLPAGQAWWPSGPQPVTALPQISAYVIAGVSTGAENPATAATALPSNPLALTSGTELSLRVMSVLLPDAPSTPTATPSVSTPSAVAQTPTLAGPVASAPGSVTAQPPTSAGQPVVTNTAPLTTTPSPATPPTVPTTAAATTTLPLNTPPSPAPPSLSAPPSPLGTPSPAVPTSTPGNIPVQLPPENQDLVLPNRDGWPQSAPTPPTSAAPVTPQAVITGTVVTSLDGEPVVQTPDGQIQLNVRANLPPGTVVTLEITARQAPSTLIAPPPPMPAPATLPLAGPAAGWPTLLAAVEALERSDPAVAAQFANIIPDGGTRSALAMMSIAQALRSGDPRQWPGDGNLRALERAGPRGAHLANQLAGEVSELSRNVRETPGEWRALPIPWQADGRVERVRLVVRETDGDEDGKKKKGGGGTRFLLDLDLSRLGPLQLDGMFKKDSRSFDMMVRTRAPLPENMRVDLAGLFANSNAAMNLVGGLSFQVVKTFPDPLAGPSQSRDKSGLWV